MEAKWEGREEKGNEAKSTRARKNNEYEKKGRNGKIGYTGGKKLTKNKRLNRKK